MPVRLGRHKGLSGYRAALKKAGCVINPEHVDAVLLKAEPSFYTTEVPVDLYKISGTDVGVVVPNLDAELFRRFQELEYGFELCSVEAALAFRLEYRDQPAGDSLLIAMDPVGILTGTDVILEVSHGNGTRRVDVRLARRTHRPDQPFVVMRRRA